MGSSITAATPTLPAVTPTTAGSCCPRSAAVAAPVAGGGGSDLTAAITALEQAVTQLKGVVDALVGTGLLGTGVVGGGAQSPTQSPTQAPPAAGAPAPADQAAPPVASVRDKIVAAARSELAKGVKEDAGADNDSGGNIRRYRTAVTGAGEDPNQAEAWCADFASYVWQQAGTPFGPDGKGEDYTVAIVAKAKSQGTWRDRAGSDPKPGDMVLLDWDSNGQPNHVAVVEKVDGGRVFTIGGNESNQIRSQSYPAGDKRILGYATVPGA